MSDPEVEQLARRRERQDLADWGHREWIRHWRAGMFSSSSRDAAGWPIEMHGVVANLEEALDERDRLRELLVEWRGTDSYTDEAHLKRWPDSLPARTIRALAGDYA